MDSILKLLGNDGDFIRNIENPTYEMRLRAVAQKGSALRYIWEQTPLLCAVAVDSDPNALQYAEFQSEKLCIAAVRSHGKILRYVRRQTHEICLAAVNSPLPEVRESKAQNFRKGRIHEDHPAQGPDPLMMILFFGGHGSDRGCCDPLRQEGSQIALYFVEDCQCSGMHSYVARRQPAGGKRDGLWLEKWPKLSQWQLYKIHHYSFEPGCSKAGRSVYRNDLSPVYLGIAQKSKELDQSPAKFPDRTVCTRYHFRV